MPASHNQFLAELRLLHPDRFPELVSRLSTERGLPDVARMAQELVRIKALTRYQAAALYQGKGRGLLVGPYVVRDRIGTGGMGKVFKAVHRQSQAVVALKVLPPSFTRTKRGAVERFRQEAESLARLKHPNIVRCIEPVTEVNGVYYLVMQYVPGRDLRYLVERTGVFPVVQAIECLLQAAMGLQSAHTLKIIHRDIKPANLMLDPTNTVRILDIGLARVIPLDQWLLDEDDEATSRAVLGTIPYMAPEQAANSTRADARSDIYSLGCTFHFLLTGRSPYQGRTWSEMYREHRQAPIPSLKAARPSVPDYLEDLFLRMLAKDPADRPPTMASVIAKTELALAASRAGPSSSLTLPVRCPDEPDEAAFESTFNLEDLVIDSPAQFRRKGISYTGRRLRPPGGPWDFTPLARYLLLTGTLIVVLIVLIELFLHTARGAKPLPPATDHQATVLGPATGSLSPVTRPWSGRLTEEGPR
jgi:serine/threonine protein kinase